MLVTVYTIPKGNFCNYSLSPYQWSARHTARKTNKQKTKTKKYNFTLCLLPLKRNSDLPSSNVGFLSLSFDTSNLHFILYPNVRHLQDIE